MTTKKTTKKTTKSQKKSDIEVMFPDITICGIEVKPWSFGKLFEFSSILESALSKIEQHKEMAEELIIGNISYFTTAKAFSIIGPEILQIISMTVDKDEGEIKELSMEDGISIAVTIFNQNQTTIINSLKNALSSPLQEEENEEGEPEEE